MARILVEPHPDDMRGIWNGSEEVLFDIDNLVYRWVSGGIYGSI